MLTGPSIFASAALAQETGTARVVVTAIAKSSELAPLVPAETITATAGGKRRDVSSWIPLRGPRAGLQLVLLLDDGSRSSLNLMLNELRDFINALPPTTQIAIGYMRNGGVDMVQNFTTDHAAAAGALRISMGQSGINGSPYFCLQDLIKHWPQASQPVRREVVMVTDGIDRYSGVSFDMQNPNVRAATRDAQKAGVIVYSIYYKGAGRLDQRGFVQDSGQNYLVQFSADTGGQAYYQGFGDPTSFAPFLTDIQRKLQNQYELSFVAKPEKDLQVLKVKTRQPNTKLEAPAQVMVSAEQAKQ